MEMELVIKIAAVGIVVAVINQILSKAGRDEYAMLTTLSGIIVVLMMIIPQLTILISELKRVLNL
ncbi:MAG TPA: stage III sporulation protein AC [Clostridia bacterium]|nr:stage III sporulation protein AC [Clostridia bacterium]